VKVHLVDGTYELFRYFYALPSHVTSSGQEVAATRGVIGSLLNLVDEGATHLGVATDHVIESFRNEMYEGYKTGAGMDPEILSQFELVEEAMELAGFTVWPMVEYEADDALGAGAAMAAADSRVDQVLICTPDKDLCQAVTEDGRVVQFDRRKGVIVDHAGVIEKFGVVPESIPDYLGLVGDTADGFPGLQGWGAKSTSTVLARYLHIEEIPLAAGQWEVSVRGGAKLAKVLADNLDEALLFRRIATLETDIAGLGSVDELQWKGPRPGFVEMCEQIDGPILAERAADLAERLDQ
jgi:5'-3' exonuclease